MRHLKTLTESSMYKALTDQHEAVTLKLNDIYSQMINMKL